MGDRTSTPDTLAEDSYEFARLIPRSDWVDAVLRGDEATMRNPVLSDAVELARSLWPNCSSRSAGTLRESTRDGARLHALLLGGGELEAARLPARKQPSKTWTRNCRPTTERPTTWPFSLS